jgi:hypothetical protein
MGIIFSLLAGAAGIVCLVCWILTLVKIFKSENGVLHGVIGIICGLWAFIYGWMKADEMDNKQIMLIWTIAFIAAIALNVLGGMLAVGSMSAAG